MDTLTLLKTHLDAKYFSRYVDWLSWTAELLHTREKFNKAQESWLAKQAEILKKHLRSQQNKLPSRELIEAACFVPGYYVGIKPPLDALLPERGGFSEHRLKSAASWIEHAEAYILSFRSLSKERQNNLAQYVQTSVPQTNSLLDTAEFFAHVANARPFIEAHNLIDLYKALDGSQASALGRYALELWDTGLEHNLKIARDIFHWLACLPENSLIPLQPTLLKRRIYYSNVFLNIFYRGSQREISASIIAKLSAETDEDQAQQLMAVFVWGESDLVEQQLHRWNTHPPKWWKTYYADFYPQIAGWELTPDGSRRQLFHPTCYQLVNAPSAAPQPARALTTGRGECPWCHRPLVNLFEFDFNEPRLDFLSWRGEKLVIPTCLNCVCYATIYMDIYVNGASAWSSHNVAPNYLRTDGDWGDLSNSLTIAAQPRGAYETVYYISRYGHSQIGGFPAWVQDCEYPECPHCQRLMTYIGQLDMADIRNAEGTFYAFLCVKCLLAATVYQQT